MNIKFYKREVELDDNIHDTANLVSDPIPFNHTTDHNLRRSAQKLYKRLNYDPWDQSNKNAMLTMSTKLSMTIPQP
jgi:hypothetical protein